MKQLQNKNMKNFLFATLIWLGIACCISYMLISMATSNIHWTRYAVIMVSLPGLLIIIGAFILKTVDDLKELNFIELIRISSGLLYDAIMYLFTKKEKESEENDNL